MPAKLLMIDDCTVMSLSLSGIVSDGVWERASAVEESDLGLGRVLVSLELKESPN